MMRVEHSASAQLTCNACGLSTQFVARYARAAELMEAELDDEIVALDVTRGTCFGFNSVASSVWRALAEPQDFDALRDQLLEEYDVNRELCEAELAELLGSLTAKGLVRTVPDRSAQG